MLVFGPYRSAPKGGEFIIYNLSSLTEAVPRLPGLFVLPAHLNNPALLGDRERFEKEFDIWYYNYVIEDPTACSSLMAILISLYQGNNVYVCISDVKSDDVSNALNESFMKLIQSRYDIKYSVVNDPADLDYVPKDGCDFMSVAGITTFDQDRKAFMQVMAEQQLMSGGSLYVEEG